MSLYRTLNQRAQAASAAGDRETADSLKTLLSETMTAVRRTAYREPNDMELVAKAKEAVQSLATMIESKRKIGRDFSKEERELALLSPLVPSQMSQGELEAAVSAILEEIQDRSPKAMGQVMARLKELHAGRYDGKAASEAVRRLLAA